PAFEHHRLHLRQCRPRVGPPPGGQLPRPHSRPMPASPAAPAPHHPTRPLFPPETLCYCPDQHFVGSPPTRPPPLTTPIERSHTGSARLCCAKSRPISRLPSVHRVMCNYPKRYPCGCPTRFPKTPPLGRGKSLRDGY